MSLDRIDIRMTAEERAMAREVATARGVSVSELVRTLLHAVYAEHVQAKRKPTKAKPKVSIRRDA